MKKTKFYIAKHNADLVSKICTDFMLQHRYEDCPYFSKTGEEMVKFTVHTKGNDQLLIGEKLGKSSIRIETVLHKTRQDWELIGRADGCKETYELVTG